MQPILKPPLQQLSKTLVLISNMDSDSTQFQQAQLEAILGPDPTPFETLVSDLMSSGNEQRSQAESQFNLCKQNQPNLLVLRLAHLLQSSTQVEIRAMSAILLRKQLTRDDAYIWPRLSRTTKSVIKYHLLACVQREETKSITKKLCDTVAELASSISPDGGWPELLPFMFQCVKSDNPRLQEWALLMFAQLAQYIGETLIPHLDTLHTVFLQCLSTSSNPDVRIASLGASINFIQCLSDRDKFQDLLPSMMQTLTEALDTGQEAIGQEALELLIELAGTEPKFLGRQLVDVVGSMLQIAGAESLEEATRHLAIEFVITLAEARERAPGMMRKLPQFIRRLLAILMKMLLDVEDDPAWHTADSEDEDAGETSSYSVGQECLDRLSIALGGNTIVPVASELLPLYLAAPEWQKHHAALIALAQIAEGCAEVMTKNLAHMVAMVLNSFRDPHPRVRWAAINAVGQLSTDLGPDLQVQYHQQVLPALASAMDDFQNPRVQAHAASAVLNFSENCTPDILTPYLDEIVSKLLALLQNGKQMVQEGALTALASVANSSQEQFQKYYDSVMPCLKVILTNATDKSNRMLRGKLLLLDQEMEVVATLQRFQLETAVMETAETIYNLQEWARLGKFRGQDVLSDMSFEIPPLLQSAQLKPDVTITSADSGADLDVSDDERMASGGDDSFASFDKSYETFSDMNLNERLLAGIFGYGFEKPSEVQQKGIVPLCEGLDVLVQAESEPGRTAAFCTAILQRYDYHLNGCQCIVFAPTATLVEEIARFLRVFGTHLTMLQVYACGEGFSAQDDLRYFLGNRILTKVVHVVVGTPPSVLRMFEGKTLRPDHIKMVILDDGYNATTTFWMDHIRKISQLLPSRVQVGVFAETISPETLEVFHLLRNRDKFKSSLPVKIVVKQNVRKIEGMTHYAAKVPEYDDMPKILLKLLAELPTDLQCVIFVNNRYWANHLLFIIRANLKLRARVLHRNMDQTCRDIIMRDFRARSINVLITPDRLARGFDMEVPLIINYEMTGYASVYNERIARFGRNGGGVISIVPDDFGWYLDIIHEECDVVFEDLSTGAAFYRTFE